MSRIFPAYARLLTSGENLVYCQQASDFNALLLRLKHVLQLNELSNDELIHELNSCNQLPLDSQIRSLASNWLPYRYNPLNQNLYWCLPTEQSGDPFHDQYIERCRQKIPLNQLLQPKTSLDSLGAWQPPNVAQPAAFIFHLSRCGSTLLSGCLSELDNTLVLSESALLTEFLLDKSLSPQRQQHLLPKLIHLQGNNIQVNAKVVIKWNAWDLLFWPIIRINYPHVPVLFVVREPTEILASHLQLPGRHMMGDPSLSGLHLAFSPQASNTEYGNNAPLIYRIRVLSCLMNAMLSIADERNVWIADYNQINLVKIKETARNFALNFDSDSSNRIRDRMHFHSKEPNRRFCDDSRYKQQFFNPTEFKLIKKNLWPQYKKLSDMSINQKKKTHYHNSANA